MLLPGEPLPVHLMNTVWADRAGVHDTLATLDSLRGWLAAVHDDATAQRITENDIPHFYTLRAALRRLAAHRTEDPRARATASPLTPGQAVAAVNRAITQSPASPQLTLTGHTLGSTTTSKGSPAARVLACVATQAIPVLTTAPLQACLAPACVVYFTKDHPRREWCSTTCGNRARAARHYNRHKPTP
ncbi:CGNR zinc finger domain-containing protein [Crossiella sp. CA198]|uniref:CGNR zinc finger domain-containing protein n=1 Tax=Crossiella sp. CA198 TaxID=3455607 RepID=UPI003F8D62E4